MFRPGRKVCAIQRRRRGEGVGARGWGRGRRRGVLVCPSLLRSVRLSLSGARGRRAPARCVRPEPGALRLQPRRAPVAAARPPATLPLPLNSCAKYAALRLRGSRSGSSWPAPRPLRAPRPAPPPPGGRQPARCTRLPPSQ